MLRVGTSFLYTFLLMGTGSEEMLNSESSHGECGSSRPGPRLTESWHITGPAPVVCGVLGDNSYFSRSVWMLLAGVHQEMTPQSGYSFKVQCVSGASHIVIGMGPVRTFQVSAGRLTFCDHRILK